MVLAWTIVVYHGIKYLWVPYWYLLNLHWIFLFARIWFKLQNLKKLISSISWLKVPWIFKKEKSFVGKLRRHRILSAFLQLFRKVADEEYISFIELLNVAHCLIWQFSTFGVTIYLSLELFSTFLCFLHTILGNPRKQDGRGLIFNSISFICSFI